MGTQGIVTTITRQEWLEPAEERVRNCCTTLLQAEDEVDKRLRTSYMAHGWVIPYT